MKGSAPCAGADASRLDPRQLASAARAALLRSLASKPSAAAALWLCAAHAAAWGRLPDPAVQRMGFRQAPLTSLTWHTAPPASTAGRVRASLAAAARAVGLLVRLLIDQVTGFEPNSGTGLSSFQ